MPGYNDQAFFYPSPDLGKVICLNIKEKTLNLLDTRSLQLKEIKIEGDPLKAEWPEHGEFFIVSFEGKQVCYDREGEVLGSFNSYPLFSGLHLWGSQIIGSLTADGPRVITPIVQSDSEIDIRMISESKVEKPQFSEDDSTFLSRPNTFMVGFTQYFDESC